MFFGSARTFETSADGRYYNEARELARRLTEWSDSLNDSTRRFVVCSGGGPGIMEAANRGAQDAGGKTIGLNIGLPFEQRPNPFITPELSFEFHYFFMRKFWFAYLAKALVVFPGGFGTLDELTEILTLVQTQKLRRRWWWCCTAPSFWKEILNFDALVRHGMIAEQDLESVPVRRRRGHRVPAARRRSDQILSGAGQGSAGHRQVAEYNIRVRQRLHELLLDWLGRVGLAFVVFLLLYLCAGAGCAGLAAACARRPCLAC